MPQFNSDFNITLDFHPLTATSKKTRKKERHKKLDNETKRFNPTTIFFLSPHKQFLGIAFPFHHSKKIQLGQRHHRVRVFTTSFPHKPGRGRQIKHERFRPRCMGG